MLLGAEYEMPIEREGQFLVTQTLGDVSHIGLESSRLASCVSEAGRGHYKGVFGSPSFGFTETSLDSLRSLPELLSIWFWDISLKDVDAVYELTSLRSFGIHPRRPGIDFSRLSALENLTVQPVPKDRGFEALSLLKRLHLWHYSPKDKTFTNLVLPKKIEELEINWASPKDLTGLSPNPNLIRLGIHRCRNLESLAALPSLFPSLEHLVVTACGKLDGRREAGLAQQLPGLKHAYIQGCKVVSCGRRLTPPSSGR